MKDITRHTLRTLLFTVRGKKLKEKPGEVQFKSQDIFGYMPLSKESFSSYMKLSKSGIFLGRT
jgi:hypothetical protein